MTPISTSRAAMCDPRLIVDMSSCRLCVLAMAFTSRSETANIRVERTTQWRSRGPEGTVCSPFRQVSRAHVCLLIGCASALTLSWPHASQSTAQHMDVSYPRRGLTAVASRCKHRCETALQAGGKLYKTARTYKRWLCYLFEPCNRLSEHSHI